MQKISFLLKIEKYEKIFPKAIDGKHYFYSILQKVTF